VERVKRDSTRGRARILPVNYKGDALVQVWVDSRKLAMLSRWLDEGGYSTRYLSEVVRFTIDEVVEKLVESGVVEKIEFTGEARDYLVRKYRVDLNPRGRGRRNILHNMQLDEIRKGAAFREERLELVGESREAEEARRLAEEGIELYEEVERREREKERRAQWERIHSEFVADERGVMVRKEAGGAGGVKAELSPPAGTGTGGNDAGVVRESEEEKIEREIREIEERDKELANADLSSKALGLRETANKDD